MTGSDPQSAGLLSFSLVAWSAWSPDRPMPGDWAAPEAAGGSRGPAPQACRPPGAVPPMIRRRASPAGRNALAAASAMPDILTARYILSTRHGELARTSSILDALIAGEELSPMDFSMSIHHGLTGLLSMAAKNTRGHTAITAGPESFCYALLEAAACIAEREAEPVILLHCDEGLCSGFENLASAATATAAPMVAALNIAGPDRAADSPRFAIRATPRAQPGPDADHVLDFIRFVSGNARTVRSSGRRMDWEWHRV